MKHLPECGQCGAWLVPPRTTLCLKCEEQINAYANAKVKEDQIRGYPALSARDERSTDGRSILAEIKGQMKNYEGGRKEE